MPMTGLIMQAVRNGAANAYVPSAGPSLEAETTALLARMSVAPSSGRQTAINDLIAGLKADGIWSKLSCFFDVAAETEQQALLDWTRTAQATNNGCVFTANAGFKTTTTGTPHVDLGFAPAARNDGRDDLTLGAWTNVTGTSPGSSVVQMGLIGNGNIQFSANGQTFGESYRLNDTSNTASRNSLNTRNGHRTFVRPNSTTKRSYFAGAQNGADVTQASTALSTGNFALFVTNITYNTQECGICFAYVGSALTGTEVANLHSRLATYRTAASIL